MSTTNDVFDAVNAHIEAADLTPFENAPAADGSASFTSVADSKVCDIYKIVRPFLKLLPNVPFIPKKWKRAIEIFCDTLDAVCGV